MSTLPAIRVGCDPELFLRDTNTGQFVTAYGVIPGTKDEPFKVPHGAIQVDGMAVEFGTDPVDSVSDWRRNVKSVMGSLREAVPPHLELVTKPFVTFDREYFDNKVPPEAKVLGCDPDFNAYTGLPNPRPNGATTMRTASGHIHIGWRDDADINDPDHQADCREVAQQLDFYVGLASLLWDPDPTRRKMYGLAGAIRYKKYGVEYRTPSNMWLTEPEFIDYVYHATSLGVTNLFMGKAARHKLGNGWAQGQINHFQYDPLRHRVVNMYAPYLQDAYMPGLSEFAEPMIAKARIIEQNRINEAMIAKGLAVKEPPKQKIVPAPRGHAAQFMAIDDPILERGRLMPGQWIQPGIAEAPPRREALRVDDPREQAVLRGDVRWQQVGPNEFELREPGQQPNRVRLGLGD